MPGAVFVPARAEDLSLSFASGVDSAAQGAILYRNASSRYAPLAAGTNGQVLTSGGASANPSWTTITSTLAGLSDVSFTSVARGNIIYRGASAWNNLAPGTAGQALLSGGAGADPSWGNPTADLSTAVILAPSTGTRNDIQPTADVTPLRVLARVAGQTANLTSWLDTSAAIQARVTAAGLFSCPGAGASSERFGAGTLAAGSNSVALGNGASASGNQDVALGSNSIASGVQASAIGYASQATNTNCCAFGWDAQATNSSCLAIGVSSRATASNTAAIGAGTQATAAGAFAFGNGATGSSSNCLALGNGAAATNTSAVAIGASAATAGSGGIAIGASASAGFLASVAMGGSSATATAANQMVVGAAAGWEVNQVYICGGVTSTSPTNVTYNSTGGSGANVAGGNITIAGGKSTGSAAGGSVIFSTCAAGGAGSTLNGLTPRWTLDATGLMTIADANNIAVGTTTGTKIGTVGGASGQKLGFFAATPIVQPLLATGAGATVDNVITMLQNLGLCRQT